MCYHIAFTVKLESILDYFPGLIVEEQLEMDFPQAQYLNGFNHPMHPVMLIGRKDKKKHLANMMWGFLPNHVKNWEEAQRFWNGHKDEKGVWRTGYVTLNAIGEEILEKKMYRDAALNRRCVIFVDGFYEWRHIYPLNKRTGHPLKTPNKYPYHIKLTSTEMPFIMMAGIWNPWRHAEADKETGELIEMVTPTFALCTAPANKLMSQVHNSKMRMPTILTKDLALEWISEGLGEERIKEIATSQFAAEQMTAFSIAKDFQEVTNPKEACQYEDLEPVVC
ncbi:SOS response-associated peptidase family protein [Panacibacter sp. DH6]|uniref:Abasic site processing protein n=1 Tax=Panacibacter microcysteis TaxID=2793269 RepID=A0A931MDS7_9BACT|nr:SOS response-associated peptidase family protein [Panacibacter microcysteis]MBG9378785.1 SOS response-associated peptidase family protein [Panacibacter microcysteis]